MAEKDTKSINLSEINLSDVSESLGQANEMHPKDRARLVMAYWVLGSVFLLFLLSSTAFIFVSECKLERAKQVFEFVKNFGPPLVTLVLGFYFREAVES